MNRFKWALVLACALPVVAVARPADAPRTEDRHRDADRSTPDNASDPGSAAKTDAGPDHQAKSPGSFTAEEREETETFLATNSPRRWNALKSRGIRVNRFMVARYLELRRLQADDSDLYNIRLQEIKADDEIFGQARLAASDPAAKERLHNAVAALVDLRVQEQVLRIKKLNELLHAEQDKLDRMNKNRDKIIERHEQDAKKGPLFGPASTDVDRDRIEAGPSSEPSE